MSLVSFKNIFTYGETSTMRSYIPATPATLFANIVVVVFIR